MNLVQLSSLSIINYTSKIPSIVRVPLFLFILLDRLQYSIMKCRNIHLLKISYLMTASPTNFILNILFLFDDWKWFLNDFTKADPQKRVLKQIQNEIGFWMALIQRVNFTPYWVIRVIHFSLICRWGVCSDAHSHALGHWKFLMSFHSECVY